MIWAKKIMSVIVQKLRPRKCATGTCRLTLMITRRIRSILLRTVCQLVTWTTITADTTASAAASSPSREETISHENPAAIALLIANRSNGDLDDHRLRNLLRGELLFVRSKAPLVPFWVHNLVSVPVTEIRNYRESYGLDI